MVGLLWAVMPNADAKHGPAINNANAADTVLRFGHQVATQFLLLLGVLYLVGASIENHEQILPALLQAVEGAVSGSNQCEGCGSLVPCFHSLLLDDASRFCLVPARAPTTHSAIVP